MCVKKQKGTTQKRIRDGKRKGKDGEGERERVYPKQP